MGGYDTETGNWENPIKLLTADPREYLKDDLKQYYADIHDDESLLDIITADEWRNAEQEALDLIKEVTGEKHSRNWTSSEKKDIKKLRSEIDKECSPMIENAKAAETAGIDEMKMSEKDGTTRIIKAPASFFYWAAELGRARLIAGYVERKLYNLIQQRKQSYFTLPSGSTTYLTKKILNNPNRIESPRRGQIKQKQDYLTRDSIITYKGNDSELTVTLERTKELFTKKMQNGAKVFNFLLQKLNDQNRQEITKFQLQDLVDEGIYANKDSASRGLKKVFDKMYAISIEGIATEYDGRKKVNRTYVKSRIISAFKVSYNECIANLTPIIREATPYITILPNWSYTLNENSFMLLDYIFYMARQKTDKIKRDGHFNISLEAIRTHLGLPTVEDAGRKQKQLIADPVEKAIGEILDASGQKGLNIICCYDLNYKNIHEFLSGYIQIELDEIAQKYMAERAIAQENEYNKEQKRIEKARQKAAEKGLKN